MKSFASRAGLVLGLSCAVYILSFFHRVCPAVISLDLGRDLSMSSSHIGFLSSSTMLAYGLMQLPSGLLADAVGGRKAIVGLSILAGLGTLGFALGQSYGFMVASRFAVGAGLAVTVPALAMLALWFPPQHYGRASSILLCCGGLGGILAAPPLAALSDMFGWRLAIACFGVLTLGMALLVALLVPDKRPGEVNARMEDPAAGSGRAHAPESVWKGVGRVFRTLSFWPLALWQMCMAGSYFAMASLWWGPYLMQGNGLSKLEAGWVLTAASLTLLVSQPVMGYLSDAVFKARKMPVLMCSTLGILGSCLMVVWNGEMSFALILLQTICCMIGMTTAAPLVFTMTRETFPVHLAGTATGCMNMFYPLWAVALQRLYGSVLEYSSASSSLAEAFGPASMVIVINSLCAFGLCFFMKETHRSRVAP